MLVYFVFSLYFLSVFLATTYCLFKKQIILLLPVMTWLIFYIGPFVILLNNFPQVSRTDHAVGGSIVGIAISIAVLYAAYRNPIQGLSNRKLFIKENPFLDTFLLSVLLIVPLTHYCAGGFPLASKILNSNNTAIERFEFSRISGFAQIFFYLANLFLNFFSPLLINRYIARRHFFKAFLATVWVAIYALSSTALEPFAILISALIFLTLKQYFSVYFSRIIAISLVSLCLIGFQAVTNARDNVIKHTPSIKVMTVKSSPAITLPLTAGDLFRVERTNQNDFSPVSKLSNYLIYRTLLTPIEVSDRWYTFYNNKFNQKRSITDVLLLRERPKASNLVAKWAYYERFPNEYYKFAAANASFDAESFSFGWIIFGFTVLLLIIILKIIVKLISSRISFVSTLGTLALLQISFLLFQAGPLAILIAQGLWIIFPLYLFDYLYSRRFADNLISKCFK